MAKSPAAYAEEILRRAFEVAEAQRATLGYKPRGEMVEERQRGGVRNWWGPKSYHIKFYMTPWQYLTLQDNAAKAGMSAFNYILETSCTDSHMVRELRKAGLARQRKVVQKAKEKLAAVTPLRRKKVEPTPSIIATHYGLPTRRAVAARRAHG